MPSQSEDIRILGLTQRKFSYENGKYQGRAAGLYNKLDQYFTLIGLEMVHATRWVKALRAVRAFHPAREQWRVNFHKMSNTYQAFQYRSQLAQRKIQAKVGQFDLIFQLNTMQSPDKHLPYVLTMDSTRAQRMYYWSKEAMSDYQNERWMTLEKEVYQNAQFLFPRSEDTRQSLIKDYEITPDKVICVGAGTDFWVQDLQKKDYTSQIALFVGIDFERKGGHVLLESWKQVIRYLPKAKLQIIGPKTQLVDEQQGVEWLGRITDRQYLQSLFDQATVLVLPSYFEPWGLVISEAMGLGIPCIVPNHLGGKDMIIHGETGFQVEPGDVDSLAEYLITLLSNPKMAKDFGYAGWQRVVDYYNWDAVINRMAPYIRSAVKGNST